MYNIINFAALLLFFFAEYGITATLPLYITEQLQLDALYSGYIVGMFSLSAMIAKFFSGILADKIGKIRLYGIALFLTGLVISGYTFAAGIGAVLAVRFMQGFTSGTVRAVYSSVTVSLVLRDSFGKTLGVTGLAAIVGMMAAAPLAVAYTANYGYRMLFLLLCLCYLFAGTGVSVIRVKIYKPATSLKHVFERAIWAPALLKFTGALSYSAFLSYGIVYAKEVLPYNSGYVLTIYALANVIARPLAGVIADRAGDRLYLIIITGGLTSAVGYYLFSSASVLAGAFLIGLGVGIDYSSINLAAFRKSKPEIFNRISATLEFSFSIGLMLGAFGAVYIAQELSFVFALAAGFSLLTAAAALRLRARL